jgi:hypothetical protein
MMHKGTSYVEDSITTETKDHMVVIKPFLITRKKVSRAVGRTLRNSAKNWIVDYLKTKTAAEIFEEILSNQFQRPLSLKLKKTYPLAICEIRIFETKQPLIVQEGVAKKQEELGQVEIKKEEKETEKKTDEEEVKEKEVKIEENLELASPESKEDKDKEEKPKKKRAKKEAKTEDK